MVQEEPSAPEAPPPPPLEPVIDPSRMLDHLAKVSQWVLADSASSTTLESLVVELLLDFGGGVLFLFQGEEQGIKFVVASEASWLSNGEELLEQVAQVPDAGPTEVASFAGTLAGQSAWIFARHLSALERPYLFVMAVPRFEPGEWALQAALRTLGDHLILGLVHHVGQYEPILFGRRQRAGLTLDPELVVGESPTMKRGVGATAGGGGSTDPRAAPGGDRGFEGASGAFPPSVEPRAGRHPLSPPAARGPRPSSSKWNSSAPGWRARPGIWCGKDGCSPRTVAPFTWRMWTTYPSACKIASCASCAPGKWRSPPPVSLAPWKYASSLRVIAPSRPKPPGTVSASIWLITFLNSWWRSLPSGIAGEDLPLLIQAAVNRCCHQTGKRVQGITVKALEALAVHDYPGNLPELENLVRRLVYLCPQGRPIDESMLPEEIRLSKVKGPRPESRQDLHLEALVADTERAAIREALRRKDGNKSAAARLLGLSRNGLASKLKRLDLE